MDDPYINPCGPLAISCQNSCIVFIHLTRGTTSGVQVYPRPQKCITIFFTSAEICETQCSLMKSNKTKNDVEKMEIPPTQKSLYRKFIKI